MQKLSILCFSLLGAVLFSACGQKEISKLDQSKAAQAAANAHFEVQLGKYADAEKHLAEAAALNPAVEDYWFDLAAARCLLKNKSGARDAFKKAVSACEASFKKDPKNSLILMKQIQSLVFLGRTDDARALLDKAVKLFPNDAAVRAQKDAKWIDQLLADPSLKDYFV